MMKFYKKNKKGDKLISVYWFAILVIVATAIVIMVNSYYSSPYDVRHLEAEILAQKVADCVYFGGEFDILLLSVNGEFKDEFRDNFLERCKLDFDSHREFVLPQYYLEMDIYDSKNFKATNFSVVEGNLNLAPDCKLKVNEDKRVSKCFTKTFFAKGESDKIYGVRILTAVSKTEENVK